MAIITSLKETGRGIFIAIVAFFGIMFLLVGLFIASTGGGVGPGIIGVIIGLILIVYALIKYRDYKILKRVDKETEGMTNLERKAYLEEKGRLAAQKEEGEAKK